MRVKVHYTYGFNTSGTGQHEVIEYVGISSHLMDEAYVILYVESDHTAKAIAALMEADGGDNNWPDQPTPDRYVPVKPRYVTGPYGVPGDKR
jgi:hypothetical protein